ncbi:MAG: ABC transporter permease [Chitinophagaceae bacterium]
MLKNYFKITWRNLVKNKFSSFINIGGLATGMAVAILIGCWIWDEVTFNHYHGNHHRIAEIVSITTYNGSTNADEFASVPMANEIRSKYPDDFEKIALITSGGHLLSVGDKKLTHWGMWAQAEFPSIFSLRILKGSSTLNDASSMLISESLAKSLFGDYDPLHKTITVDDSTVMRVAGVYEDLPQNSNFHGTEYLLSWENKNNPGNNNPDDWTNHHFQLFLQLKPQADINTVSAKIKNISKPHLKGGWEEIMLHPMNRWHLYNEFANGKMDSGRIQFVWIFGIIGCSVLLLACINFMNLSTARSEKRAKEVGVRKAVGSLRGQLIAQFYCESLLVSLMSLVAAMFIAWLALPYFNILAGKKIVIPVNQGIFWSSVFSFTILTAFIAGSYPAIYLSGFKAIKVLKGTFRTGKWASLPRKALVIMQFSVSVTLIIGTITIFRQVQYAKGRPVGYSREGLIRTEVNSAELKQYFDALRNDLINTGVVDNAAISSSGSTEVQNSMVGYSWKGGNPNIVPIIGTLFVSYEFGKTIDWKIKEGRDFSRGFPADSGGIILNEAAVKFTGFPHPVGETIKWGEQDHTIVGVVNDLVMESPYSPVQPTFFMLSDRKNHVISIRVKPTVSMHDALAKMEPVFKKYNGGSPFEYQFTDENYARKFSDEEYIGKLAMSFTILAIFISCLGLFGLASFLAEQRTREIGIRKVVGASVFNLWKMLSSDFIVLVIISCLIAIPLAWYFLNQWLQQYEYRTEVSGWIFLTASAGALVITILTVSFQSIKAAIANPVKSLRTE